MILTSSIYNEDYRSILEANHRPLHVSHIYSHYVKIKPTVTNTRGNIALQQMTTKDCAFKIRCSKV